MRSTYLKAVLRQDVGYFDLDITSTSEIITSVSNDTLVIEDALSNKQFISQMPQGYDTQVGERGIQMSGVLRSYINKEQRMLLNREQLLLRLLESEQRMLPRLSKLAKEKSK